MGYLKLGKASMLCSSTLAACWGKEGKVMTRDTSIHIYEPFYYNK